MAVFLFQGKLSSLAPISLVSVSKKAWNLPASKWLTQYFAGAPVRYVGRHSGGDVETPTLKSLDEIRDMCGLDSAAADLWLKVVKSVLQQIVAFAFHNLETTVDHPECKFAIIVDPESDQLSIFEHEISATEGSKVAAVSESTFQYLITTLE